ncbi:MAG TPA: hypothetical protein VFE97_00105 [Methylomirabilota bacterium]|nr:hypothetical protein [Methylomirabilota bacterium]
MAVLFYDRHDREVPATDLTASDLEVIAPAAAISVVPPPPRSPRHRIDAAEVRPDMLLPRGGHGVIVLGATAWATCSASTLHTVHYRRRGAVEIADDGDLLYVEGTDGALAAWSLRHERELHVRERPVDRTGVAVLTPA